LLEYNGVYLAEGPWPAKAYFDAHRRARARDAALHMDYGFTKPEEISRGPMNQEMGSGNTAPAGPANAAPPPARGSGNGEPLPPPNTVPVQPGPLPAPPAPAAPQAAPPQASDFGRGNGQWSVAERLPPVPADNRIVDTQVGGASWTNPIRDDRDAMEPNPDSLGGQVGGQPVNETQGMAVQLPVEQPAVPVPSPQPAVQLPVEQPAVQVPAQQPVAEAASDANPLREAANRPVGDGPGLR
jgi:hypothetical protein